MGLFNKKSTTDHLLGAIASEVQVVRDVLLHSPPRTTLTFGAPTRCPGCGDFGFVKSVEHGRGVCSNHCFGCHRDWVVTARALELQTQIKAELTAELADQLIPPPAIGRVAAPPPDLPPDPVVTAAVATAESAPQLPVRPPDAPRSVEPAPAIAASASFTAPVPEPVLSAIVERAMQDALDDRRVRDEAAAGTPLAVTETDAARPVRLLVIEDNPFDYAVLEMIFDEAGPSVVDVTHVETFAEGFDQSNAEPFDVILLDLNLPDSSGFATIDSWQEANAARTPVIAMTSISDPHLPAAARDSGVAYFVRKTQIEELTLLDRSGADRFVQLLQTTIRKATK